MKKINNIKIMLIFITFCIMNIALSQKDKKRYYNFGGSIGIPFNLNKETSKLLEDSLNLKQSNFSNFSFFHYQDFKNFIINCSFVKSDFNFTNDFGKYKINQLSFVSGIGYSFEINKKIKVSSTINFGYSFLKQKYLLNIFNENIYNSIKTNQLNCYSIDSKPTFLLNQELQLSYSFYKNYQLIAKYTYAYINPNTPKILNNRILNNINFFSLGLSVYF